MRSYGRYKAHSQNKNPFSLKVPARVQYSLCTGSRENPKAGETRRKENRAGNKRNKGTEVKAKRRRREIAMEVSLILEYFHIVLDPFIE